MTRIAAVRNYPENIPLEVHFKTEKHEEKKVAFSVSQPWTEKTGLIFRGLKHLTLFLCLAECAAEMAHAAGLCNNLLGGGLTLTGICAHHLHQKYLFRLLCSSSMF